jgi:hypothetical protein
MDAKDLPRTELELLRHAYAVIMEVEVKAFNK